MPLPATTVPLDDLPKVRLRIGAPTTLSLDSVLKAEHYSLIDASPDVDYYLSRFGFVVMAAPSAPVTFERIRFQVHLLPTKDNQPVFWDLLPSPATRGRKHVTFSLDRTLRFQHSGVDPSQSPLVLEYDEVAPAVETGGLLSDTAFWEYSAVPDHRLEAIPQVMHAVIRAPKATRLGHARIAVSADLRWRRRRRLPPIRTAALTEEVDVTLWNGMKADQAE